MNNRASPLLFHLFVASLLVGCIADTAEPDPEESGQASVAEATEALTNADRMGERLPIWHTYVVGNAGKGRSHPILSDQEGRLLAVRASDGKRVELKLAEHWMHGDSYFDEKLQKEGVTAIDLLMIASDLFQKRGAPGPATKGPHTYDCFECGDNNPFPGIWGNPSGPGPAAGTAGSRVNDHRPAPVPPPHPHPSRGHGSTPVSSRNDPRRIEAFSGVLPGDPEPIPFPDARRYAPKPGEQKTVFKCEGTVYSGYRGACVDFEGTPVGMKWTEKLMGWETRYFSPNNISRMTTADWKVVCEILSSTTAAIACAGLVFACADGEVITLGGVTVTCLAAWGVLCAGHGAINGVLISHCGETMTKR